MSRGIKLLPLVKGGDTYLTDQMIQMYSTYGDLATNDNKQPTLSEQNVIKLSLDCNKCLSSDVTYTQGEPQHGIKLSENNISYMVSNYPQFHACSYSVYEAC